MTKIEYNGVMLNAADFGMDSTFTFEADGKVTLTMFGESNDATYTVSDNTVTIVAEGQSTEGVYDPETDAIAFVEEEDGQSGKLILERKSNVGEAEPVVRETVAATEADVIGTWVSAKAAMGGTEIPIEMLGVSMTMILREDGTVILTALEESVEGATWSIENGKVVLRAEDKVLYEIEFDGTNLLIAEKESGVTLIFEKQN